MEKGYTISYRYTGEVREVRKGDIFSRPDHHNAADGIQAWVEWQHAEPTINKYPIWERIITDATTTR